MKYILVGSLVALTVALSACIDESRERITGPLANPPDSKIGHSASPVHEVEPTSALDRIVKDQAIGKQKLEEQKMSSGYRQALESDYTSFGLGAMPSAESAIAFQGNLNQVYPEVDREKYIHFSDNGIKIVSYDPVSTFSIDVDTASYSNVRRMLEAEGRMPPKDAVRIEELVNYFSYEYPVPESLENPFSVTTEIARSPWNPNRHLLQIGLRGYEQEVKDRPAANLIFLVDVSGSMMSDDKLPLVKRSLRMLVNQMKDQDRIALVAYAGAAGLVLDSTGARERGKILRAINALQAGGSTNGGAGLNLAYNVAREHFIDNGINRVIIASDGDMNVGIADHEALKNLIEQRRKSGIALTTLGFGTGNFNYALMEQLADVGNGNAAYIDSIKEAHKVLVNEMQSTLLTIAQDVKIQIEFNPAVVSEYRLVGYENRVLNREDFRNDKVDAGDIGSGHTVTAFYEIALVDSEDSLMPELRYGSKQAIRENPGINSEIAFVRLRFKHPNTNNSKEIAYPVLTSSMVDSIRQASADMRFAASVAGFGQILRGGKFTGDWRLDDAVDLARSAKGSDQHGYRGEFIRLVELVLSLGLES